jgi:hypothetical protein
MRQNTPMSLGSLLSPLTRGLKPFLVNPLGPSFFVPQAMPLSPSPLVAYLYRHSQGGLLSLTPTYCSRGPKALNNGLVLPPLGALPGPRASLLSYFSKGDALYPAPLCRVRFSPTPAGLGLDEKRLVRLGTSKLVDSTMLSSKLESPATPSLALPSPHLTSLGLGWSTSASLSSYPSYKLSRGGVFRRPFSGLTPQQRPLEGLKEGFKPLSLDKKISHVGLPLLTLFKPSGLKFHVTPPSLDSQIGAWSPVWACLTPAPTEDLDPIFINSVWTPEVNTTRRSDHNARYLVSWSPLLSPLTSGSSLNKTLSGPTARASQSPLLLRSSLLALNEIGLKNSFGVRGNRPFFIPSELGGSDNFIFQVSPSSAISPSPLSKGPR